MLCRSDRKLSRGVGVGLHPGNTGQARVSDADAGDRPQQHTQPRRERQVDGDGGAERRRVWDGSPVPPCAVRLVLPVPEQRRARVSDGRCGERSLGHARGGRRSRRTPSARCGALRLQRSGLCSAIVSTRQATAPPRAPPRQPKPADGPATGWPPLRTAGAPQQAGGGTEPLSNPRNCRGSGWGREAWRTAIWGSVRRPSTRCARAGPSASASRPFWRISRGVGSDELRRRFESSWVALRSDQRDGDSGCTQKEARIPNVRLRHVHYSYTTQ